MTTPTKEAYESALKTVKLYEKRQSELNWIKDELSRKLKQFSQVKFKIDKKNKEVLFSGLHIESNQLVMGKSKCSNGDKFEEVIGKLIAVKNALHEDASDIIKLVEPTNMLVINTGGWVGATTVKLNNY